MPQIISYPSSLEQAMALVEYCEAFVVGEDNFGLCLPASFTRQEQQTIVEVAHSADKKVIIAANRLLHNRDIEELRNYLPFVVESGADALMTGDPGVILLLRERGLELPLIWDTQTLNTSSANLNFWAAHGVKAALLAQELPRAELQQICPRLELKPLLQVYGAIPVQHARRRLLSSYFTYTGQAAPALAGREPLYLESSELEQGRYSIYEDTAGTHIFAAEDLNLLPYLHELNAMGLETWCLQSLFVPDRAFRQIVELFAQAAQVVEERPADSAALLALSRKLESLHPTTRPLGPGFYPLNPADLR